jgi:glycerol-3-phosphate acyltransferase PlsX
MRWLKAEILRNPLRILGALFMAGGFRALKRKTSQKTYGGAPLLGVNGICIIGHGNSDANAAKNGILQAARAVSQNLNQAILEGIQKLRAAEDAEAQAWANGSAPAAGEEPA